MWTFNAVRIFVQDYENISKQLIARLNPLGGGTILHFFGYEDIVTRVSAYVVGYTDQAALEALARTGLSYELISPDSSYGDFFVNSVNFKRQNWICQTIRPDLAEDAPVFLMDLELYYDE